LHRFSVETMVRFRDPSPIAAQLKLGNK
jgi:hypothetical protein